MNGIMNYIFGSLRENEIAARTMLKKVKAQTRFNRMLSVAILFMGYRLLICEIERREQRAKTRRLEKEVNDVKKDKESKEWDD